MNATSTTVNFVQTLINAIQKRLRKHTQPQQLDADTCDLCCCELKSLLEESLDTINKQPASCQLEIALAFFKSVVKLKTALPTSCEALNLYALDINALLRKIVSKLSQDNPQVKAEALSAILALAKAKSLTHLYDERFNLLESAIPLITENDAAELNAQIESLSKKVPAREDYVLKYILLKAQVEGKMRNNIIN